LYGGLSGEWLGSVPVVDEGCEAIVVTRENDTVDDPILLACEAQIGQCLLVDSHPGASAHVILLFGNYISDMENYSKQC
jgi:hypothetical protein